MLAIPLRPVDAVTVTTLMDNSCDALLPDEGLVRRWGLAGTAGPLPVRARRDGARAARTRRLPARRARLLRAGRGRVDGRTRRVLFDAGDHARTG